MPNKDDGNPRGPILYKANGGMNGTGGASAKGTPGLFGAHEGDARRMATEQMPAGLFGKDEPAAQGTPVAASAPAGQAAAAGEADKAGVAAGASMPAAGKPVEADAGQPSIPGKSAGGRPGTYKKKPPSKKQRWLNVAIISLIVLLVACIVLAAVLPGCLQQPGEDSSVSGDLYTESGYDPDANQLRMNEFVGTVLPETDRADADYVTDTLFLGDSNTVRMMSYNSVTGVSLDNAVGVVGMGIQAFTSLQCAKFQGYASMVTMPEAVEIMQPRRVVITFGTNNVGGGSTDGFISSYEKALDAVKEAYPYADIIIGSIFPVDRYHENQSITMTNIDKFNLALVELAEKKDVKFLNWSEALRDDVKSSAGYGFCVDSYTISDGIHISQEGMKALFAYFNTHAYVTEDTRPKPLKAVPARLETPPGLIISDPAKTSGAQVTSVQSTTSAADSTVVNFVAGSGGQLQMNGATQGSFSVQVALGGTCPSVVAVPQAGYRFVGWSCTVGRIDSPGSPTLPGFYVFPNVDPATGVTVSASFELIPVSSAEPPATTTVPVPDTTSVPPPATTTTTTPPVVISDDPETPTGQAPASTQG